MCVCVPWQSLSVLAAALPAVKSVSWPPFTLPYGGVCYCNCNQSWKALGCRVDPDPPNNSSLSAKQKEAGKQASRANNLVLFLFGWNLVRKSAKSQQKCNHVLKCHCP